MIKKTVLVLCMILACTVHAGPAAAQTFQSKRLNLLLERKGWIRIGLTESTQRAVIILPSGGNILVDGRPNDCTAGSIIARASGGLIQVDIPGVGTLSGRDISLVPPNGFFEYNKHTYRGKARLVGGSSITVINEIMIDDWLKGVLPAEIGSDSPMEALKAQAIVARSEAIFRLGNPPHKTFDFCTGVHCQAYKGMEKETANIIRACEETLGYVLLAGGDIANAVYHNVCGGATAGSEDVWDGGPVAGLTPIIDSPRGGVPDLSTEVAMQNFLNGDNSQFFCNPNNPGYANYAKKYFRWSKTLDASQAGRMAGVGTLTDIRVTQRQRSGRVRKLLVVGTNGSKTIEKELPIRRVFDLWSGLFVVSAEKSGGRITSITFTGAGNGHGVGLCQHGARTIASRGGTFSQILGQYYPTATLQRVYRP